MPAATTSPRHRPVHSHRMTRDRARRHHGDKVKRCGHGVVLAASGVLLCLALVVGGATPGGADHLPRFTKAEYRVNEDVGGAVITVESPGTEGVVLANYTTADGTGSAGGDYTATTGTLRFEAGERTKTFTVAVLNDGAREDDETILLTLSEGRRTDAIHGGVPQPGSSATLVVVGNDGGVPGAPADQPSPSGPPGVTGTTPGAAATTAPGGGAAGSATTGPATATTAPGGTTTPGAPATTGAAGADGAADEAASDDAGSAGPDGSGGDPLEAGAARRGADDDDGGAGWLVPVAVAALVLVGLGAGMLVMRRRAARRLL